MPWATRPPQRFSRKLMTANPTIWAQQPATAAPPARPVSPRLAQMAAEEIGSVSATDTRMPMKKGCSSVAHLMASPTEVAAVPIGRATSAAKPMPARMVTMGVTRMSILVSLLMALPTSAARIATKNTASGPPVPPSTLVAKPTVMRENSTSGGASRALPMATAMAGPTISEQKTPMV